MTEPTPASAAADADLVVLLDQQTLVDDLGVDVRAGLTATPKWLPPKYFYDDRGSALFEQITALEEYYPTRREREALTESAREIAKTSEAEVLVELGSGSSDKTRVLLAALEEHGTLRHYVAVDVSPAALEGAVAVLAAEHPDLPVTAVVADFERHLGDLPAPGQRCVAFLGSTIGNLVPEQRARFLRAVSAALSPGETFLLGIDLVKDTGRLVAAYDDAQGVTAEFNRNVLRVLADRLGSDLDPDDFEHRAVWDPEAEWMEMRLRARRALTGHVRDLGLTVRFEEGEELRTETSAKFRREGIEAELRDAGLEPTGWWTDPAGDVALVLALR
jgi:L-histidine N-alpha-methyltransferase